jgi:hypothetical protein
MKIALKFNCGLEGIYEKSLKDQSRANGSPAASLVSTKSTKPHPGHAARHVAGSCRADEPRPARPDPDRFDRGRHRRALHDSTEGDYVRPITFTRTVPAAAYI